METTAIVEVAAARVAAAVTYVLTIHCADRPGLVAALANAVLSVGGNIIEAAQYNDRLTSMFFARLLFRSDQDMTSVKRATDTLAVQHGMTVYLDDFERPRRVLVLASQFDHCLGDLLYRKRVGELNMEVVGIVGNHPREVLENAAIGDIPFHYLPVTRDTKSRQEQRIKEVALASSAELVILARYMQILSDDLASHFSGRCINIHHAFLPSFKGAKPYHQAYERGVKIIGATAHYVTADLDEGPIISQDIEHISHADAPEDLVRKGRNIEQRVLARAVAYHLQSRVLLYGRKTIVFQD